MKDLKKRLAKLEAVTDPKRNIILLRFIGLDLVAFDGVSMTEDEFNEKYPNWKPDFKIKIGEGLNDEYKKTS